MTTEFIFSEIEKGISSDPSLLSKVAGVFHFKVGGKSWAVDLKNGNGSVKQGAPASQDVTITCAEPDFINLMTGQATGQSLFMSGKIKIQGNMALAMKLDKIPKVRPDDKAAPTATSSVGSTSDFKATAVFDELAKRVAANPSLVQAIAGVYQWNITGPGGKTQIWTADLKNGKGSVSVGKPDKADCTLNVSDEDFVAIMTGKANSQQLFMQGKLKIQGNMALAMKLNKLQAAKANL